MVTAAAAPASSTRSEMPHHAAPILMAEVLEKERRCSRVDGALHASHGAQLALELYASGTCSRC